MEDQMMGWGGVLFSCFTFVAGLLLGRRMKKG